MANISCKEAAEELLRCCLAGGQWRRELLVRLTGECSAELFTVVAEGLADRFEPRLCETYAELFAEAFGIVEPGLDAGSLVGRYRRIRDGEAGRGAGRGPGGPPYFVFVLSRVTLGADVVITSIILDAVKRRFPRARIFLVGGRKSWELFECDERIEHLEVSYPRAGSLRARLEAWRELRTLLTQPNSIVIDPDSRLTQLGLLPVCADEDYYFFESRGYGGDGDESLGALTRQWVVETFGVEAKAYIAPRSGPSAGITVSLGVGENASKRIGGAFETGLLRALAGPSLLVDKGAGGEEAERVAAAGAGLDVRYWDGAFAPFASAIAGSRMYVGYDSAGQHVAAACGVPLVSVFAGFPAPRMFSRWRPTGPGPIEIVRVEKDDPDEVLTRTLRAIGKYGIIQT